MVAHFYETAAHYFCRLPKKSQFCSTKTREASSASVGFYSHYNNIRTMTKAELERKKNLARTLYMAGKEQAEIAEQIEVSRVTISKWANTEGWKEQRAAKNVTRPELVNKLLLTIDTLISQVNESGDPDKISGLGDRLAKLSSVIQKLDKKANVVDAIEVFMAFSKWMQFRAQTDPNITPELLKTFNYYQDLFISDKMNNGFSCEL